MSHLFFSNILLDISDESWDCDDMQYGLIINSLYSGDYDGLVNSLNEWDSRWQGKGGNAAIVLNSRMNTRTGYYMRKYLGDQATSQSHKEEGNWKYFRLGEVYLNYAEAAIEAGHVDEGLKLINDIRHRAGFDLSVDKQTSDQSTARLWLRNERQVELAFEECRYLLHLYPICFGSRGVGTDVARRRVYEPRFF